MKKVLLALCAGVALTAAAAPYQYGTAYTYKIGPDFHYFDNNESLAAQNDNWPDMIMQDGCSFGSATDEAYGTAAVWFNNAAAQPTTVADADALCPVVEDPWNMGDYALEMTAPIWWGYGNFNFALPQANELCRVRVIFRVDTKDFASYDNANGILVRMTTQQIEAGGVGPLNLYYKFEIPEFWTDKGYRVCDMYYDLPNADTYMAVTFMPGGFSCGGNKPTFYLEECSIVPVKLLEGDTHKSGDVVGQILPERPALVEVEAAPEGGEDAISEIAAAKQVGVYDLQGRKLAAPVKGINIINGVKTLVK